jgi:hypothetical protein
MIANAGRLLALAETNLAGHAASPGDYAEAGMELASGFFRAPRSGAAHIAPPHLFVLDRPRRTARRCLSGDMQNQPGDDTENQSTL